MSASQSTPRTYARRGGLRKLCACSPDRWLRCEHLWYGTYKGHRRNLGVAGKREADAKLVEMRAEIDALPANTPTAKAETFAEFLDTYRKRAVNTPGRRDSAKRGIENQIRLIERVEIPGPGGKAIRFVDLKLAKIRPEDVEALIDARRAASLASKRAGCKGGEVQINRLIARLKHIFGHAIKRGLIRHSPIRPDVVAINADIETPRSRVLSAREEEALLAHAGEHLRDVVVSLLTTGLRKGEVLGLRWSDVRYDEAGTPIALVVSAGRTKTGRLRKVSVRERLREVLVRRRVGPDGEHFGPEAFCFGTEFGEQIASIQTAWRATCRRAGIADAHVHDLRRTWATRLREAGADLLLISRAIGHTTVTMTSRYLGNDDAALADVYRRIDGEPEAQPEMTNGRQIPAPEVLAAVPDDGVRH